MTLSEELQFRGFVNQTTFKNISELDQQKRTFYFGVDPSAPSATIGNLASMMMARVFIAHGYTPILLVGGATGLIGDPKETEERGEKSLDEVERNKELIKEQYSQVFGGLDVEVVDNYEWFSQMNYLDFLRIVGKRMSMSQLVDREFVKNRIGESGSGLSYAEFSYSLIQGYDFLHLYREKNVTLQLCGADQWGNSLTGVELIRKIENKEAHVWSCPLVVNKTTGLKFGKSEEGAVWLDSKLTSPYAFYQFWLNVDDAGVEDYLKIYTLIDEEALKNLMATFEATRHERLAQKYLAYEVTTIVHGQEAAESIKRISEVLFSEREVDDLTDEDFSALSNELPTSSQSGLIEFLVDTDIAKSKGEARRLIEQNSVSVNGEKATLETELKEKSLIKKGKNTFAVKL
ncbi:tyrosine--tRNA ligase [Candidatus Saccharibacteria bacterium]|jgi:tyrosyl-tRNA synthetase|nr:tyrosine--tRNA ligase [Candidatus Saccharibacteria bacterium]